MIAGACDVRTCVQRMHTDTGDLRDFEVSDISRPDLATQGLIADRLDAHRRYVTTYEICPELRTLPRRDTVSFH